jgi:hypothetical protein
LPQQLAIASQLIQTSLKSKENSHHFFSSIKSSLILTSITVKPQIYRSGKLYSTHYTTLITVASHEGKGRLNASKPIKELGKHIFCKKLLWLFLRFIYSMPTGHHGHAHLLRLFTSQVQATRTEETIG